MSTINKTWVISLGGSKIVPDGIDTNFLKEFKSLINSYKSHKFIVVTGGGSTARKYIDALRKLGKSIQILSDEGVATTRHHAKFMTRYFGRSANEELPKSMKDAKNMLSKNHIVFTGALRSRKNGTTDSNAAKLASYMNCPFINLTNVKGLYSSDPKKNKKAKFIPEISFEKFHKIASKIKFEAGQHFVLDQKAALEIMKNKVPTYIVGSLKQIKNILENRKFAGTEIK